MLLLISVFYYKIHISYVNLIEYEVEIKEKLGKNRLQNISFFYINSRWNYYKIIIKS